MLKRAGVSEAGFEEMMVLVDPKTFSLLENLKLKRGQREQSIIGEIRRSIDRQSMRKSGLERGEDLPEQSPALSESSQ